MANNFLDQIVARSMTRADNAAVPNQQYNPMSDPAILSALAQVQQQQAQEAAAQQAAWQQMMQNATPQATTPIPQALAPKAR